MPESIHQLLENNRQWVSHKLEIDSEYFEKLSAVHSPKFLWIGCSDSRVPANQITGTKPGEIFVHRNIANLVVHTDMNLLSVIDYAVQVLKVKHIIVCGHYGCGGIQTALGNKTLGLIDNWLRNIKDVYRLHEAELNAIEDPQQRERRLAQFNVIEQVHNLSKVSVIQKAWSEGEFPILHGWVYDIHDGLIENLEVTRRDNGGLLEIYRYDMPDKK